MTSPLKPTQKGNDRLPHLLSKILIGLLLAILAGQTAADIMVRDFSGRPVHLPAPAVRAVSLDPGITGILLQLGGMGKLVGVDDASGELDFRLRTLGKPGQWQKNKIQSVKPDIIFVHKEDPALRRLDIPIFVTGITQIRQLPRLAQKLGLLMGQESAAIEQAWQRTLARAPTPSIPYATLIQIHANPLITANGNTLIGDAVAHCGGDNPFAQAQAQYPLVTTANVPKGNKPLLVLLDRGQPLADKLAHTPNLTIYPITMGDLLRPTPTTTHTLEKLCQFMTSFAHHLSTASHRTP